MFLQDFSADTTDVRNGSSEDLRGASRTEGPEVTFAPLEGDPLAGAEEGRFTGESSPEKSHCQSGDSRGGEMPASLALDASCSGADLRPDLELMVD